MRLKRILRFTAASVALVCMAALSACNSGKSENVSELRWGIVADNVPSVDPLTLTPGNMLLATMYDALLTAGPDGQLAPGLAESWDTPDLTTYVFHLRDGVKFWNGNELTADDVVASLDYERLAPSPYESLFVNVKDVTAKDPNTVVVKLERPDAGLLSLLASVGASIFEKKFYEEHKKDFGKPGTLVMATGPYKLDSLSPTEGAEFSANDKYWGKAPAIKHVSVKLLKSETNAAIAYRSGELDAVYPLSDPKGFASTAGEKLTSVPGCKQTFLSMNTRIAPLDDVHARRAVAYAIDRKKLVSAEAGGAETYASFFPPMVLDKIADESDINALMDSTPGYDRNLDQAKSELAKSGSPDGFEVTLEVPDDGTLPRIAQALSGMLKDAGITLDVKVVSPDQYTQHIGKGEPKKKLELTLQRLDCAEDPSLTAGTYLDGSQADVAYANYAAYEDSTVDELLEAGLSTNDDAKRFDAYSKITRIVASDVPYVPLLLGENVLALSDRFTWPQLNPFSSVYGPAAWVSQVKPS